MTVIVICQHLVLFQVQHLEELCFTLSLLCGQQTVVVLAFEERPGMEGWRDTANTHGLREEKVCCFEAGASLNAQYCASWQFAACSDNVVVHELGVTRGWHFLHLPFCADTHEFFTSRLAV